jgi:LysM repeat protein
MRTSRHDAALALVAVVALLAAGCGADAPPTPAATAAPSAAPTPTPVPTARQYRVRSGDTLAAIARRFGRTVGQLLTANPSVTNPDLLQVGQVLVIPPPDAPDLGMTSGGVADPTEDVADADGNLVAGQGYVDMTGFGARLVGGAVRMEIDLAATPPRRADPAVETLTYTILIDTDANGDPDYRLVYGNAIPGTDGFGLSLQERATAQTLVGADVPATVTLGTDSITIQLDRSAIGGARQLALAASVERDYRAGGAGDPEVDLSFDYTPNQQWPRPNPRWVDVGG